MKRMVRIVSLCVLLTFLTVPLAAFADLGVQVIGQNTNNNSEASGSIDDMKLEEAVEVDGFGTITPIAYEVSDKFGWYREGRHDVYWNTDYDYSGNEGKYIILWFDILNDTSSAKTYQDNASVKVVYDEKYEYTGWVGQLNYDNRTDNGGPDAGKQNTRWVINSNDKFAINPMYKGHYMCVVKVPNYVLNHKEPLLINLTFGTIELTYNIRK